MDDPINFPPDHLLTTFLFLTVFIYDHTIFEVTGQDPGTKLDIINPDAMISDTGVFAYTNNISLWFYFYLTLRVNLIH